MEFTAAQLAEWLNGKVEGDSNAIVTTLAKIEEAEPSSIAFLANPDYIEYIYSTRASIVIVANDFEAERELEHNPTLIRVEDARMAFATLLNMYQEYRKAMKKGIHPTAVIDESATVGEDVYIGPYSIVGANATIGDGAIIEAHCIIGENVKVGAGSFFHNRVTVEHDCIIGEACEFQPGVVIGGDGFGFQPNANNEYQKVQHIGNVIIEDHVEIGANTTIDRATMGSTIIRKGVKLDNLIQVGHNCEVGENTVMAAQSGIAGSTTIGKNCMIGGQVGFNGHIKIADGTRIGGKSGIQSDIVEENTTVQGMIAFSIGDFRKSYLLFRSLPKMERRVREIEKSLKLR